MRVGNCPQGCYSSSWLRDSQLKRLDIAAFAALDRYVYTHTTDWLWEAIRVARDRRLRNAVEDAVIICAYQETTTPT